MHHHYLLTCVISVCYRFMRVRDDKKPEGATTAEQIVDMYYQQGEVGDKPQANDADDDEDYL